MNSLVLSPLIRDLADRAQACWRAKQPIAASLWGPVQHLGAEDLSDAGLLDWIDHLERLGAESATARARAVTVADEALLTELDRVVSDKLYQARVQQPYRVGLSPYLMLIGAGLLPFVLTPSLLTESPGAFEARLTAACQWLGEAERRHASAGLSVREQDLLQARRLAESLAEFIAARSVDERTQTAAENLGGQLRAWAEQQPCQPTPSQRPAPDLESLLDASLGTKKSLAWWQEQMLERLDLELERFNQASADGGTLDDLANRFDWPAVDGWSPDGDSGHSDAGTPADPFGVLPWLKTVYQRLQRQAHGRFFRDQPVSAPIRVAPPLATILVPEALFLFDPASAARGSLLISPQLLQRTRPMTWRFRMYAALVVAHELCPGHHLHVVSGRNGALAPYLDVFQSPTGLEGWAVHAEHVVAEFGAAAAVVTHYQYIRRLLPATLALTQVRNGKEAARQVLTDVIRRAPTLTKEITPDRLGWSSLPYAVGLLEAEMMLGQLYQTLGAEDWLKTREAYLAQGILSPSSAARMAAVALRSTGQGG
ncbi:MAG TPA: hypothetical protein VK464_23530 [Symbiobacteriaceae bacterium]|jgi:hypothetical protein|nr:hypothetical protein [Symbiobacteriaceae bacterium]